MSSSDAEEWEEAPEDDSEDESVPEAPPDPAAIRAAYPREQAQAQAPRAAPDPDPDDETLDDLRAKAAANQEPPAPATTNGADAAYSFVELPAPQHKEASSDLAPRSLKARCFSRRIRAAPTPRPWRSWRTAIKASSMKRLFPSTVGQTL